MNNSASLAILRTLRASALIDERFTSALAALHGVSLRDVILMLYVKNAPGSKLSRVELARRLCVSPSTVTRATSPLEKIGVIDRQADSRDARLSYVILTPSGRKLLGHAEKALEQLSAEFLSPSLTDRERTQFASLLGKLTLQLPGEFT